MAWALQDCDRTLKLGKQRKEFSHGMKEKLRAKKELRKKAVELAETQGAKLEGTRAELRTAQAELAELKVSFSKSGGRLDGDLPVASLG